MVVALLGALKCGAGYVPLDSGGAAGSAGVSGGGCRPGDRGDASVASADSALRARDDGLHGPRPRGDRIRRRKRIRGAGWMVVILPMSSTPPEPQGSPKGAMISHHAVCNYVRALRQAAYAENSGPFPG